MKITLISFFLSRIHQNGNTNNSAQPLGDFISLSNNNSSTLKRFAIKPDFNFSLISIFNSKQSSSEADMTLSSSDENDADLLIEY
jgi:hypothetical protein